MKKYFLLVLALLAFSSCTKKETGYTRACGSLEKNLQTLEKVMLQSPVTAANVKKARDLNSRLCLLDLEDAYHASIKEGKTSDYNTLLRVSTYRLIALRDKSRQRVASMSEKESQVYFYALMALSDNVTMLWRHYYPDDRHVTEAVLSH